MGHALKEARRVLAAGGVVVDAHPEPVRAVIFCDSPAGPIAVGRLTQILEHYRAAAARLHRIVERGLLLLRHSESFHVFYHYSSLGTVRAHLTREWTSASVDGPTLRRIRSLLGPRGQGPILIDETVRISILEKA